MTRNRDDVKALDASDPLASVRDRFAMPSGVLYLDGNSLGPLSVKARDGLDRAINDEWGTGLIRSWNDAGWFEMPLKLGDRIGALVGAAPGQVVCCDSTSINIFKTLHAALGLRPERRVILSEADSFPTDLYMTEGVMAGGGSLERRLVGQDGARFEDLIDEDVAVVLLSHVNYRTGEILDMKGITEKAQAAGALVIWDLCHSAGVLAVDLDGSNADFAVGCTYKYLNGGPGSPAFLYVAERHQDAARQPLTGWWGHAAPFAFERDYRPSGGIRKFLCGTQPILSMRGVQYALDTQGDLAIEAIRAKSLSLTRLFIELTDPIRDRHGIELMTPRDDAIRGSQVALGFEHGFAVVKAMIGRSVIGDFRAPDIMRFGFSPLYLSHADVWEAAEVLAECLDARVWEDPQYAKPEAETVT